MAMASEIRPIVQVWGGKFMTSAELAEAEKAVGLPPRMLYFRGRSAVLGDLPPAVAAELFGIFPHWLFALVLPAAVNAVSVKDAVVAYTDALARWSGTHLAGLEDPERLAALLQQVLAGADASGLALFAGWRAVDVPAEPLARVGHSLMVLREFRGGVHFAALRANAVTVPEAVVADPEGGYERLLRTAWQPAEAEALVARARARSDLDERWRRAEAMTDEVVTELLDATLTPEEQSDLLSSLRDLDAIAKAHEE
ncbi:hypothetical protein FPZ12_036895 [Amycolatopsis acidicola]|uniref:Uncharacterized protein n=1 Tax=Amycolatopsis acidicola TaxID=2596893 RepID=A0A5N0UP01_9PSEU|nr:hypothetical protein [Amycolatopsis acidicola]KAA9152496.1 hypothetical protein FPZ12_036895 [Amycolatopsis acidicola]